MCEVEAKAMSCKIRILKETVKLTMRRPRREAVNVPEEMKDEEYYERRLKNTVAAKRCRDKKRHDDEFIVAQIKNLTEESGDLTECIEKLENRWEKNQVVLQEKKDLQAILAKFVKHDTSG